MGADNWAVCPRCTQMERQRINTLKSEMDAVYGNVALADFDQLRATHETAVTEFAKWEGGTKYATFRENYEIYGATDGTVVVGYSGYCKKCGCGIDFTHEVKIDV